MPPKDDTTSTEATTTVVDHSAELAALKAQLAQERSARIKSEAEAFTETQIRDQRMLPAERAHWVELYTQLASDDSVSPRAEGARIDLLRSAFTARAQHDLTIELASASVLTPTTETKTPKTEDAALVDEAGTHARAYAERMNKTKK